MSACWRNVFHARNGNTSNATRSSKSSSPKITRALPTPNGFPNWAISCWVNTNATILTTENSAVSARKSPGTKSPINRRRTANWSRRRIFIFGLMSLIFRPISPGIRLNSFYAICVNHRSATIAPKTISSDVAIPGVASPLISLRTYASDYPNPPTTTPTLLPQISPALLAAK